MQEKLEKIISSFPFGGGFNAQFSHFSGEADSPLSLKTNPMWLLITLSGILLHKKAPRAKHFVPECKSKIK